nr:putative reverse transcriptase domain-containing protein [Tanacetum cinerariifolium]
MPFTAYSLIFLLIANANVLNRSIGFDNPVRGPFEILDRVGEVSYRLALPPQLSHVHDVFHVSLLRGYKYHPLHVITYPLDQIRTDLSYEEEPEAILDRQDRIMRKKTIPRFFGGTIPSGKPLGKPRSLSGLLILISFHDMV